MPKTQLDWLAIVSLWIGAVVMAFKAASAPLVSWAPDWLTANFWNHVPLVLVTFYLLVAIYRQLAPASEPAARVEAQSAQTAPAQEEASDALPDEPSSILPAQVSEGYTKLMAEGKTSVQEIRFLRPYVGKWIELNLRLLSLENQSDWIRAICRPDTHEVGYNAIVAFFKPKWEDHLQHLERGDTIRFRAKISQYRENRIVLDYAEPT